MAQDRQSSASLYNYFQQKKTVNPRHFLLSIKRKKERNLLPCVAGVNMKTYRPSTWQPSQINTVEGAGRKSKGGGEREGVRERERGTGGVPFPTRGQTLQYNTLSIGIYVFCAMYYKVLSKTEPKRMDRIEGT